MIEFRNVSKVYNNGTEALHNINLNVEKGEFVFIVGSSGAGKSTFLKLVMCEERPNSGQIFVDGVDVSRIPKRKIPYIRRKMGIVFQDFRLIDHMTVYDNVAFAMRVVGASPRSIRKRVPYILSLVGLQHKAKHYPTELSGGERQRVGLARALVNNPSMIIADEPTGNIDPALSFEIVDLLSEINRRGTTVLMVTHEHSLVKHFHKRIIQTTRLRSSMPPRKKRWKTTTITPSMTIRKPTSRRRRVLTASRRNLPWMREIFRRTCRCPRSRTRICLWKSQRRSTRKRR